LLLQLKSVLRGQRLASIKEVTPEETRALRGIKKLFPGILPRALRTLAKVSLLKGKSLWEVFCK
jgi:hypothetical protein